MTTPQVSHLQFSFLFTLQVLRNIICKACLSVEFHIFVNFLCLVVGFIHKKKNLLHTLSLLTLISPRNGMYYCLFLSPLPFSLKNAQWINCENLMIFSPRQHIHLSLPQNKFHLLRNGTFNTKIAVVWLLSMLCLCSKAGCYHVG